MNGFFLFVIGCTLAILQCKHAFGSEEILFLVLSNEEPQKIADINATISMKTFATGPSSQSVMIGDAHASELIDATFRVVYSVEGNNKRLKVEHKDGISGNFLFAGIEFTPGGYVLNKSKDRILAVGLQIESQSKPVDPKVASRLRRQKAQKAFTKGDYLQTAALLEGFYVEESKLRSRDLLLLGRSYARLNDWWQAERNAQHAYELDKTLYEALYNIVCYRTLQGDLINGLASLTFLVSKLLAESPKTKMKFFDLANKDDDLKNLRKKIQFKQILSQLKPRP